MAHEVHIEKLAFGGAGIGRINGKTCFVRYTAPGDLVDVAITKDKKSYSEGSILRLVAASDERTVPPCPIFGQCGGCTWQHISYDNQLKAKKSIFREILWRTARVEPDRITPVVAAPDPWHYRSRIQIKLHYANNRLHLGFFRSGSHYVIDFPEKCFISDPRLNETVRELRNILRDFPDPARLPQIDLAVGESRGGTAIFHYIGDKPEKVRDWVSDIAGHLRHISGTFIQTGRKRSLDHVTGEDGYTYGIPGRPGPDLHMKVSAGGFSQVNFAQNRNMVALLHKLADFHPSETVLDLYCGNGNLSLPAARSAGRVVGVEDYAGSITDAVGNAAANATENIEFTASDAASGVRKATSAGRIFDVLVLDPPRTGAADVINLAAEIASSRIIYVSCDPMTLGRDIAHLTKNGYSVKTSTPIDMFPQTYHIESITLLIKN